MPGPKSLIHPGWILGLGVAAVSLGAIFARLAEAPALLIAACRSTIAAAALGAVVVLWRRHELAKLDRHTWLTLAFAGALLALHFATWISSLDKTTVASSLVLVNTAPFWVALAAPRLTGDVVTLRMAIGIGIGLLGSIVIGAGDFQAEGEAFWGDVLALIGGIAAAGYVLAGRRLRRTLSLPVYGALCYGIAGVMLWGAMLVAGTPVTGLLPSQWGWIVLVGLVPQLIGHSSYNWALGYVAAPLVSLSLIGEPIVASLLAWWIFDERPSLAVAIGGAAILAGIVVSAWPTPEEP
ncbi:MAG TPA: DMT family transporter [Fimbriimonadaceae bacterium]|nr:DMT family transporter [Fimbriimonadaceae bacterium]HRJ97029.1 DMT family transporter [Fimbriimonadaceae bacterium]